MGAVFEAMVMKLKHSDWTKMALLMDEAAAAMKLICVVARNHRFFSNFWRKLPVEFYGKSLLCLEKILHLKEF
jgi:hypothetical protein